MEFDYYSPSETFVVLTADQFVGRDDGLLEQQKQDSHVCRRNGIFPLILRKNQSPHCVQLKAFFHDKEDDSNTSDKDISETLQTRKSKWTPPEGQFASLDFFYQKNAVMTSISLISIVTPNFPTFLRKRERRSKILVSSKT